MPPLPHRQSRLGRNVTSQPTAGSSRQCPALSPKGQPCYIRLRLEEHRFCSSHHHEFTRLNEQYKQADSRYERFSTDIHSPESERRAKLECGKLVLKLRDEVSRRFFNLHSDNRGHIQRILRLQTEITALEATLGTVETSVGAGSTAEPSEASATEEDHDSNCAIVVYRSLLALDVPMSDLDHLPRDHLAVLLKPIVTNMANGNISKLYALAPSLNDKEPSREFDAGDEIVRFVFREYILWKADTMSLHIARQEESFHTFITRTSADLRDYIKFFETFGRADTLHFLRDAVCDYLVASNPPTTGCTKILGAAVATPDNSRAMSIRGWDLLYSYFADVVEWYNVEKFCVRFEDLCLVKKLIAYGRYSAVGGEQPGWLNLADDVSQESTLAVMLGLVAITKGFSDPLLPAVSIENNVQTAKQSRCYLAARMSNKDPTAELLTQELVKRVSRYVVVIDDFDVESYGLRKTVAKNYDEDDPWITRAKSGPVGGHLNDAEWKTEWSLKNIHSDLERIADLKRIDMQKDYREFIVIDRSPGADFMILDDVAGILARLCGCRNTQEILDKTIKTTLPMDEQENYLKNGAISTSTTENLQLPDLQYEGNRVRSWTFAENKRKLIAQAKRSRESVRITRRVVDAMEAKGLITSLCRYRVAHVCPTVLQGQDGVDDVYFPFRSSMVDGDALVEQQSATTGTAATATDLKTFAERYKSAHPRSIAAKGRVHTHYCAWPLSIKKTSTDIAPLFRTAEGLIFRWNVLPFDWPLAAQVWQSHVQLSFNAKLAFARCVETTMVVCGEDLKDAEKNLASISSLAEELGWQISVPAVHLWTSDLASLRLDTLWAGVEPNV